MTNEDRERLVRVEQNTVFIKEALETKASKSSINWLKWALSGVASMSVTALLIACGIFK